MKKTSFILIFLLPILIISCSVTQQTSKCDVDKIIEENIENYQKGYSLKIPSNWISYIDIHCNLTSTPREIKKN